MIKLKLHSVVDIITNSSTVIYTYYDDVQQPLKEMLNEILKVLEVDKTVDDIFHINIFLDDIEMYDLKIFDKYKNDEKIDIEQVIDDVIHERIEKPDWMIEAEGGSTWDDNKYSNSLYIVPKEEKYKDLSKKILKFLNSVYTEAVMNN